MKYLLLLTGLLAWCTSSYAQRSWQVRESHTRDTVTGVVFLDEHVGFAVSDTIHYSTDQGAVWTTLGRNAKFAGVERSASYVVAITQDGRAVRSSDQGVTWETRAIGLQNLKVTQATSQYIYAAGERQVVRSDNSGMTWERQVVGIQEVRDISFSDANHGFMIGKKVITDSSLPAAAEFYFTTDRGDTWTDQYSSIDSEMYGLFAFDKQNLIAVGGRGTVARSADGGRTWRLEVIDSTVQRLNKVHFRTRREGVIIGTTGVIYATNDGGLTWRRELSGVNYDLVSIANVDEYYWIVGGEGGTILQRQPPTYQRTNLIGRIGANLGMNFSLPEGPAIAWGFTGGVQYLNHYFQARYFLTTKSTQNVIPNIELVDLALMWGPAFTIDQWFLAGGIGIGYVGYDTRGAFMQRLGNYDIFKDLNTQGLGVPLQVHVSYIPVSFMNVGLTIFGNINGSVTNFGTLFNVHAVLPKWYIEE